VRKAIIFGLVLMLWSSAACAADGAGKVTLDVIGSQADRTQVANPGGWPVELNLIGSNASNILIGSSAVEQNTSMCCYACCYPNDWSDFSRSLCYPYSSYIPTRYHKSFLRTPCGCCCLPQLQSGVLTLGGYR